jgi:hypothetical protein
MTLTAPPMSSMLDQLAFRVRRQVVWSALFLGVVALLALTTVGVAPWIGAALLLGWVLMPVALGYSLWRPPARVLVMVPGSLVSVGLIGLVATEGLGGAAMVGWSLVTAGVLLGGGLGCWFWFHWLPVPDGLADPTSPGRWALITVHVGLILAGLVVVLAAAMG